MLIQENSEKIMNIAFFANLLMRRKKTTCPVSQSFLANFQGILITGI